MNIEPIDGTSGRLVAQALQSWPNQRAAAVAIVDEAQLFVQRQPFLERQPFLAHARTQCLDLTANGVLLSLSFRGHPRVNGHARQANVRGLHDEPPGHQARSSAFDEWERM